MNRPWTRGLLAALTVAGLCTATAEAVVVPKKEASLADKTYRQDALYVPEARQSLSQLPALASGLQGELATMGVAPESGFYDTRTGRWESLFLARPMIPGTGVGNTLRWDDLGGKPIDQSALQAQAWSAVRNFVQQYQGQLRVDLSELGAPRVGVYEQGNLIQIHSQRVVNGIPVRDSGLTAIINHGNLIIFGLQNWADVVAPINAGIGFEAARATVTQHVSPLLISDVGQGHLEFIPTLHDGAYDFRLAWSVPATVSGDQGTWEGLVDAISGDLLAFEDRNLYASRRVVGGVFPVSNDGRGQEGVEQPGWPMPFANVTIGTNTVFTTTGGSLGCANTGAGATTLAGTFMRMSDACGAINEPAAAGADFDLGVSAGTDCTVPAGHSAGDTHSSRSGFYELNRIKEQARGYLPSNAWLQAQLVSNMNINLTCNAFWNGANVNFYRDSGSTCRNTGEIAAVFDHEWGHGLDNNGANPGISSPGESIADIHAILRLSNSCVGRGFLKTSTCGGYGDACIGTTSTGCTGVRDSDFAQHRCNLPHTVDWILNGFAAGCAAGTPNAAACPAQGSRGPCNRETHCEGQAVAEVAWDINARDLRTGPFNFDSNTALELTTRLFYLGAETVTSWYSCAAGCQTGGGGGTCGCGATGGYMLVLGADDDNGSLADGTPHGTAIKAAFDRHLMGCSTQAVSNSGCSAGPTAAPTVTATATAGGDAVTLSWAAVAGATHYGVYRTEGVAACDFGKVKVADVTATTFTDSGLLSGRPYSYVVIPIGSNNACFGRASTCATATPSAVTCGAAVSVAPFNLSVDAAGNGVLQPNEAAVSVAPTWRNTGTGPTSLTGALTNFTGPAGPTYTINDPSADYGTIAASTNQACTNCYAVTVTSSSRPVQHWDTTALETVTPSATTKTWTLHVGDSFTDVLASNGFYRFVETLLHKGVTTGCGGTNYCPSDPTNREQMSVFVLVSKEGAGYNPAACTTPPFADVPVSSPFCKYIKELVARGVTTGCGSGNYCPLDPVTRAQMSIFVLRTLDPTLNPPACTTPMFGDVPAADPFCRWIEELARRGVVTGCGGGNYCPNASTTRDQMSVFLAATFGLTLYGL